MQGKARTGEKYGDKWSVTESKIDGSHGIVAGTLGASSEDTCVEEEIHGPSKNPILMAIVVRNAVMLLIRVNFYPFE